MQSIQPTEQTNATQNISEKGNVLEICHRHHALGDEMHIYSCVWYLWKRYTRIVIHCDYELMKKFRGSEYEDYIKPFIEKLYESMDTVKLVHRSSKGISKEKLGRLIPNGTNLKLPSLVNMNIFPLKERVVSSRYVLVPTRVRYPPARTDWNQFCKTIAELSTVKSLQIVLIGEKKLDRENSEIFTIYDRLKKYLNRESVSFVDLTADNNLYKGESNLKHLYRDLNLARHAEFVITVGISGFVDLVSFVTIVFTIGSFNHSYTKLIWSNKEHRKLVKCKNVKELHEKVIKK